jgi:hypothetical protein
MCGRFTSLLSPELLAAIRELFGVPMTETAEPREDNKGTGSK